MFSLEVLPASRLNINFKHFKRLLKTCLFVQAAAHCQFFLFKLHQLWVHSLIDLQRETDFTLGTHRCGLLAEAKCGGGGRMYGCRGGKGTCCRGWPTSRTWSVTPHTYQFTPVVQSYFIVTKIYAFNTFILPAVSPGGITVVCWTYDQAVERSTTSRVTISGYCLDEWLSADK